MGANFSVTLFITILIVGCVANRDALSVNRNGVGESVQGNSERYMVSTILKSGDPVSNIEKLLGEATFVKNLNNSEPDVMGARVSEWIFGKPSVTLIDENGNEHQTTSLAVVSDTRNIALRFIENQNPYQPGAPRLLRGSGFPPTTRVRIEGDASRFLIRPKS
jgi:hypothetical protein